MMKMLDVIRQLKSLEEYLGEDIPTEARHDDEETAEYRKDVEALSAAISALEELRRNRDKAADVIKATRICNSLSLLEGLEDCEKCPYFDPRNPYGLDCDFHRNQDIERLLTLTYLQGGGDDEQS